MLLELRANIAAESNKGTTALGVAWHNRDTRDRLLLACAQRGRGVTGEGSRPPRETRGAEGAAVGQGGG